MTPSEIDYDELFRRQALLSAMQDLSEECWAAGWYTWLERDLYRIVFEEACPEYGLGWITASERRQMRDWATHTNCWYVWDDKIGGPTAIPLEQAKAKFQRIPTEQTPQGLTVQEAKALYQTSAAEDWELEALVEKSNVDTPLKRWLHRAREVYRFRHDPALYLARRRDLQFVLGYGTCQLDVVQPTWLPGEALRSEGCTEAMPCRRIQVCVACAGDQR